MEWALIDSDAALAAVLSANAGAEAVAVDTEFMRTNTFYPEVALVQLCFGDKAWLVDPLALTDLVPLRKLLEDPRTIKVLHSPSEDLEVFERWLGVLPEPLFDTQRAAALVNHGFGMGYRALVLDFEGVDLPKGETRSDWLQRPLSTSQCEYAAQDVAHLLPVWRKLQSLCVEQNKLDWVLSDGADALQAFRADNPNFAQRIKSAWKLDRRALGRLFALCTWREDTARLRNKPRGWIIEDSACLALAESDPESPAALERCRCLSPGSLRRDGETLLALLAAERARPESDLPPRLPQPLEPAQRQQLQALKHQARRIAAQLGVAPEALLQAKDYETLLRQHQGADLPDPPAWSGWRAEQVIAPLRQSLGAGT